VRQRWWQSRTWLLIVVLCVPFLVGGASVAVWALVNLGPTESGCDPESRQHLISRATDLGAQLSLDLSDVLGCDSGDGAWIEWTTTQDFDQLDAAARRAGCRDGDAEGDVDEVYWVCGSGFQRIAIFVEWPASSVPTDGSIQFDG